MVGELLGVNGRVPLAEQRFKGGAQKEPALGEGVVSYRPVIHAISQRSRSDWRSV